MKKQIAIVIALCCCVIGTSACGEAVVEGQKTKDQMEQAIKVNEVAETTQMTERTPSCETPPKILVWSNKTYYLKESQSTAEPGTHFGFMKCENSSYMQLISDNDKAEINVYSAGPSRDLLYYGEWEGKRGFALYSLIKGNLDVEELREVAWNSLSDIDKKEIIVDWKTVNVNRANVEELPVVQLGGKPPKVEHLYKVTFGTNRDGLLGPIIVFVDGDTKEVLDYGLRY